MVMTPCLETGGFSVFTPPRAVLRGPLVGVPSRLILLADTLRCDDSSVVVH